MHTVQSLVGEADLTTCLCAVKDCDGAAKWHPVFLLHYKGRAVPPVKALLPIRICDKCRGEIGVANLMTDDGWNHIIAAFAGKNAARPKRSRTTLTWVGIGSSEARELTQHGRR